MTSQNDEAGAGQIVVGLDDSPHSVAALRWAAAHAARTGATLRLVHVWELDAPAIYGTTVALRETITADARARLTALVTDTLGTPDGPGGWRLEVVEGPVGPTLVELAEDADLLVLGTGEHTGVRRMLEGSVSHYSLSHARGPLVSVPLRSRPDHGSRVHHRVEVPAARAQR